MEAVSPNKTDERQRRNGDEAGEEERLGSYPQWHPFRIVRREVVHRSGDAKGYSEHMPTVRIGQKTKGEKSRYSDRSCPGFDSLQLRLIVRAFLLPL